MYYEIDLLFLFKIMKPYILYLLVLPLLACAQVKDDAMVKKGVDISRHVPKGITVGSEAPEINGLSLSGENISSESLLQEHELVVIFYRGNWCPYCSRHLSNLNDSLQYISDSGAQVLVIGPENAENAHKTKDKTKSDFILIPDTSMQLMQAYDVLFTVTKKYRGKIKTFLFTDIAENNKQEEAMLPVPATYIIGKDHRVKWRHFDYDYTKRASVKEILDHLK